MTVIKSGVPDNPHAFPSEDREVYMHGMSLRDYFAAKAMQCILSAVLAREEISTDEAISADAYSVADAMLRQREVVGE